MTLEGLDVLLIMPEFSTAPKIAANISTQQVQISEARGIIAYPMDRPLHTIGMKFKFISKAAAAEFEDFMDAQAGKWKSFYVPSWHAELNPVATLSSGSTSLQISPVNYATVYDPTDSNVARLGHYIFCLHYDGTLFVSKVSSVAGTSPEILTLATAAPKDFTLGQFLVGFMYCVNAISDAVDINYFSLNKAEADLGVTETLKISDGNGS